MNTTQLVTKLSLGACAFVAPSIGILISAGFTWSTELVGLAFFTLVMATTLAITAYLSWACVRHGGMSAKLAAAIPAIPFAFMVTVTLPALFLGVFGASTSLGASSCTCAHCWQTSRITRTIADNTECRIGSRGVISSPAPHHPAYGSVQGGSNQTRAILRRVSTAPAFSSPCSRAT